MPSPPSCTIKNGQKTDIDCGDGCATKCALDEICSANADCQSGKCDGVAKKCIVIPPTCDDRIKNQDESDVDCGGNVCVAQGKTCAIGKRCAGESDCGRTVMRYSPSYPRGTLMGVLTRCVGVYTERFCEAISHCVNDIKDDTETDVDCGGSCSSRPGRCYVGKNCVSIMDCYTEFCYNGRCTEPSCTDNIKNGLETDVDCGGRCPTGCVVGKTCEGFRDCAWGLLCDTTTRKCITPSLTQKCSSKMVKCRLDVPTEMKNNVPYLMRVYCLDVFNQPTSCGKIQWGDWVYINRGYINLAPQLKGVFQPIINPCLSPPPHLSISQDTIYTPNKDVKGRLRIAAVFTAGSWSGDCEKAITIIK